MAGLTSLGAPLEVVGLEAFLEAMGGGWLGPPWWALEGLALKGAHLAGGQLGGVGVGGAWVEGLHLCAHLLLGGVWSDKLMEHGT